MALTKAHNRMIEGAPVNVLDYGAVGDGVTDDTAAIQAAIDSGASTVIFPDGTYKHSALTATSVKALKGQSKDGTVLQFVGATDTHGITLGSDITLQDFTFNPTSVSPQCLYATIQSNITVKNCDFTLGNFTGVVDTDLTIGYARAIDFQDCDDVNISKCLFTDGWNDTTYNASTSYTGNNIFRTINIEVGDRVTIANNSFSNVWAAIYAGNVNYLNISYNTVDTTADTAIFDRCTAGTTNYKSINYNKIYNTGKGAIKILDSNNTTAKGHYGEVIGNIIKDYARFLHTEAIFSYNNYNGTSYVKETEADCATNLTVSKNQVTNSISDSNCLGIVNVKKVVVTDNIFTVSFSGSRDEYASYWCYDVIYRGNVVENVNGDLITYSSDRVIIDSNNITINGRMEFNANNATGFSFQFTNNYLENTTVSGSVSFSFGFLLNNAASNTLAAINFCNNTIKTTITSQDGNGVSNINMMALGTSANADITTADNNLLIFSDGVKRQKVMFGDILNPIYYLGMRGAAKYDGGTLVLTVKPSSNRTDTDTITFTT